MVPSHRPSGACAHPEATARKTIVSNFSIVMLTLTVVTSFTRATRHFPPSVTRGRAFAIVGCTLVRPTHLLALLLITVAKWPLTFLGYPFVIAIGLQPRHL